MEKIIFSKGVLGGKALIRNTRISVEFVLGLLSSGMSADEIIKEYPHLEKEDIMAALAYANKILKHEEVMTG